MKNLAGISLALILWCTGSMTLDAGSSYYEAGESGGKVVCVHQFNLKPGQEAEAFEAFILNELAPLYNAVEGQQASLALGDRGLRSGKYAFICSNVSIWPPIYSVFLT